MNNLFSKYICISLIFFSFIVSCKNPIESKKKMPNPPLVLVLMVKNEAAVIEKTLNPFLQAGVPCLVLDTGSTDNTPAIIRQLFLDHNVKQGYIVEQPFVDFSTSRNYALECAEQRFPHAGFFLMIDAEWYVQNVKELVEFCKNHSNDPEDAFAIRVSFGNLEYYLRRLLNAQKKIRFVGVVHEYVDIKSYKNLPKELFIKWENSEKGHEKSKVRWLNDAQLLLKEHHKKPNDLRTIFFLGQTYDALRDLDNAILWYTKRYEIDNGEGCPEERLLACYRLAQAYEAQNNWPLALEYYLKAYNLNPRRAESLTRIADYYLKIREYNTCFMFANL